MKIGTRIRFKFDIINPASDIGPAYIIARSGEPGTIVNIKDNKIMVSSDKYPNEEYYVESSEIVYSTWHPEKLPPIHWCYGYEE